MCLLLVSQLGVIVWSGWVGWGCFRPQIQGGKSEFVVASAEDSVLLCKSHTLSSSQHCLVAAWKMPEKVDTLSRGNSRHTGIVSYFFCSTANLHSPPSISTPVILAQFYIWDIPGKWQHNCGEVE